MPPNERRAAIVAAAEALIVAQGGDVSTRAIAEAAGIAEGTIFRVFPTKDAIIEAIFEDAFNCEARRAELAQVDMGAGLEARIREVVTILQRRMRRLMALFAAIGFRKPAAMLDPAQVAKVELGFNEIAAILEPDADLLRLPPLEAARLLRAIVSALTNPMLTEQVEYGPDQILDLILNGISLHPSDSGRLETRAC